MKKYDDIINLEHYEPKYHQRMSMANRASQFAPFSALVGYSDDINEASRFTYDKKVMMEDMKVILDSKLYFIKKHLNDEVMITITYFENDHKKIGGRYLEYTGVVKKIDDIKRIIIFRDSKIIKIDNIMDINID